MGQIQMKFDTFNELIQILKIWGLTFYSRCDIIYGLFDQKMTALLVTTALLFTVIQNWPIRPNRCLKQIGYKTYRG